VALNKKSLFLAGSKGQAFLFLLRGVID